jgi:hypothetical protein
VGAGWLFRRWTCLSACENAIWRTTLAALYLCSRQSGPANYLQRAEKEGGLLPSPANPRAALLRRPDYHHARISKPCQSVWSVCFRSACLPPAVQHSRCCPTVSAPPSSNERTKRGRPFDCVLLSALLPLLLHRRTHLPHLKLYIHFH